MNAPKAFVRVTVECELKGERFETSAFIPIASLKGMNFPPGAWFETVLEDLQSELSARVVPKIVENELNP